MNGKLIASVVAALAGVTVLAWQGYSQFAPRKVRSAQSASSAEEPTLAGPRQRRELNLDGGGGPAPSWVTDAPDAQIDSYEFPKVKSPEAAAAVVDEAEAVLLARFDEAEDLSAVSKSGRLSAIDSWKTFVRPLIANDQTAFRDAVARLGGVAKPRDTGEYPADKLRGLVAPVLEASPIALEQARVRSADPEDPNDVPRAMLPPDMDVPEGAIMMMMAKIGTGEEGTPDFSEREALGIPLQHLFPAAGRAADNGERVVEVWTPAKVKGAGGRNPDVGASVFLAWNRSAQAWQPVAMRLVFLSDEGRGRLELD